VAIARPFYERPANVAYLSNHFPPFPTGMFWGEMRGLGHSAMVVPTTGEPVLIDLLDDAALRGRVREEFGDEEA
jgi:hypothetical protein